ncbi:hypothetical protein KIW84_031117 [Lathyrus oleraceus]|uniref:MATH domain-containing protein n=1 Tax=Pisum sativum TaxID=3888 RepID=A0A9D4XPW2_PEA|nr:hypothetical protein KIW84_031117 [Pisum sativum]
MEGHEESGVEKFEKFIWKLENFSRLNMSVYHEHFVLGGYPWRLSLHPKGTIKAGHLSIVLQAVETANMSEGWSRDVKFKLVVFNQVDTNMSFIGGTNCAFIFNASKDNRGFRSIISLDKLLDPEEGFLVNVGNCFAILVPK